MHIVIMYRSIYNPPLLTVDWMGCSYLYGLESWARFQADLNQQNCHLSPFRLVIGIRRIRTRTGWFVGPMSWKLD